MSGNIPTIDSSEVYKPRCHHKRASGQGRTIFGLLELVLGE